MYKTIDVEIDARGVATLWLARVEKHNALSAEMIAELHHAAEALGGTPRGGELFWARAGGVFVRAAIWVGCKHKCRRPLQSVLWKPGSLLGCCKRSTRCQSP